MKNINISQMLLKAAKSSSLMIVALASFVQIDCKSTNNKKQQKQKHVKAKPVAKRPDQRQNRVAASAVAANVVESDSHNVVVNERPINPAMPEESSVDVQTVQLPDGGFQEIQTTVEVNQEEGKVIETVETWTWYDYAKAAAITAGVAGGAYLAYQNQDAIASTLSSGYNRAGDLGSNMSQRAQNMFGYGSQAPTEDNSSVTDTAIAAPSTQANVDAVMTDTDNQGVAPEDSRAMQETLELQDRVLEGPEGYSAEELRAVAPYAAGATLLGGAALASRMPAARRALAADTEQAAQYIRSVKGFGGGQSTAEATLQARTMAANNRVMNERAIFSEQSERLGAAQDAGIYNSRKAPYENAKAVDISNNRIADRAEMEDVLQSNTPQQPVNRFIESIKAQRKLGEIQTANRQLPSPLLDR